MNLKRIATLDDHTDIDDDDDDDKYGDIDISSIRDVFFFPLASIDRSI